MFDLKDPVGKMIYAPSNLPGDNSFRPIEVIGIVKDFHFESLRQQVGPLCMRLGSSTGLTSFKVSAGQSADLIKQIGLKWKSLAPGMPFRYFFLNDSFNDMYHNEQRTGTIAIIFAVLAVVIACMGLFGLVTYMAEQRKKEIGIRKVLGATVNNMVLLLSRDFLWLVFIALIVAFPVAWWAMQTWLSDFVYRVQIAWWVFVFSGGIAMLIAFLTVSTQAIKAALANPVKSLRSE
jgi:putative ABC transport system permease protein